MIFTMGAAVYANTDEPQSEDENMVDLELSIDEELEEEELEEEELTQEVEMPSKTLETVEEPAGELVYISDTEVYRVKPSSINDHTFVPFVWGLEGDLYLAVASMKPIEKATFLIGSAYKEGIILERAAGRKDELTIKNQEKNKTYEMGILDSYAYNQNQLNANHRWSVIKIEGASFTTPFKVTIKVENDAGGHNIEDEMVYIDRLLQVYHKYGQEEPILDETQSGILKDDYSYEVYPVYREEHYQLTDIEVYHNGERLNDIGIDDLDEGALSGTVTPITIDKKGTISVAYAKIVFIYKKVEAGELTITKKLSKAPSGGSSRIFDIFIYGPEGKMYTVSLAPGQSVTLKGLEYGQYRIEEIVPMNYKSIKGNGSLIEISEDTPKVEVVIENKVHNNSWFYHEDVKENSFKVESGDE